jgi:hypothetical protein
MNRLLPFAAAAMLLASCGGSTAPEQTSQPADTTASAVVDTPAVEVVAMVITEHTIGDVPMARVIHEARRKAAPADTTVHTRPYETATATDLSTAFATDEIIPADTIPAAAPVGMPLVGVAEVTAVNNAVLVAYEKKGVEVLQVSVDAADPEQVMHVVFMSKDHVDEYDVRPGMKGAEARKLRRELKHMVHKGQVFLYEEDSNITYRMAVTDGSKLAYTEAEVNELNVEAIVWRNKHQRKAKKARA